jgi:hypothetical protein
MKIRTGLALFVIVALFSKSAVVQSFDPYIQSVVDLVSIDTLQSHLLTLESFGRKQINDPGLENTAEWLLNKYSGYGYEDIEIDPFNFSGYGTYNIIVTKQGTTFPDQYVIIDGHYDTKTGPGVNDNGSGVAIILEIARLIKDIPTKYSIRFINFSAEEYGLIGSSHYVQNVVIPQNMAIRIVFNIDEVGGVQGMVNNIVVCERDESPPAYNNSESWAFTDTLVALSSLYSELIPEINLAYGSDYVPFQINGEIITGIFEYNYSPYAHTIHDSLANLDLDYVYEMAKISVAAGMYFAQADDPNTGNEGRILLKDEISVYSNPDLNVIAVDLREVTGRYKFLLYNETGKLQLTDDIPSGQIYKITAPKLSKGIYMYSIIGEGGKINKSGKMAWF